MASQVIAAAVYWPLARLARAAERAGRNAESLPLAFYPKQWDYVMRNDALDRFGTRLEHRFTPAKIESMMRSPGRRTSSSARTRRSGVQSEGVKTYREARLAGVFRGRR
jgi:hypothetical protein